MSRDSKLLTSCISRVSFTASDMWETLHIHWTNEWWWAVLRVGTLPSGTLQNSQFTPHCLSIRIDKKIYSMWLYVFLNWPFRTKSPHFQNRIFGFFISRVFFFFPSEWLFTKHVIPLWNKKSQLQYLSIGQMFREKL